GAACRAAPTAPPSPAPPRRSPVLAAKLAVGALVGIVFGVIAEGLMLADAAVAFAARGIDNQLTGGDYVQLLAGGAAAAAFWAAAGGGGGAPGRNQVGALVRLCARMVLLGAASEAFVPGAAPVP